MAVEWLHPRSRCFFTLFLPHPKSSHLCLLVPQTLAFWVYARTFVWNLFTQLYVSKVRLHRGQPRGPCPVGLPSQRYAVCQHKLDLCAHKCQLSELYLCTIQIFWYLNYICSWSALIWCAKLCWIINNNSWEHGLQQGNVKGTKILNLTVPNAKKEILPPGPHPKVIHKR